MNREDNFIKSLVDTTNDYIHQNELDSEKVDISSVSEKKKSMSDIISSMTTKEKEENEELTLTYKALERASKFEGSEVLVLTREESNDFAKCLEESIRNNIPDCFAMRRDVYNKHWHRKFRHMVPQRYIAIVDFHVDTYLYNTTIDSANETWKSFKLSLAEELKGNDSESGITMFPLKSGRVAVPLEGQVTIMFETNMKHIHIVDGLSNSCLGKTIFLDDVVIWNQRLLHGDEVGRTSDYYFNASYALNHYYGFSSKEIDEYTKAIDKVDLSVFLNEHVIKHNSFI